MKAGEDFLQHDVTFKSTNPNDSVNFESFLASNQCDLFSRSGLGALSVLNQADQCKPRAISTYVALPQ